MKKRYLSQDEVNQIISLYQNGVKQSEIAKRFNVADITISRKLIENGIKKGIQFSLETEKQIIEYFITTKNITETAAHFYVQPYNIVPLLIKYNIKVPKLGDCRKKYSLNESYFHEIDTPNKAYILGFFYADGSVGSSDYSITINLNEDDRYILERMNEEFGNTKPLAYIPINLEYKRPHPQYRIQIYSKTMHADLISKGVIPNKSLILQYPTFLSDDLQSHFIRGALDGDGCITRTARHYGYITTVSIVGTYDFCIGVQKTCKRILNIDSHVYLYNKNNVTSQFMIRKKAEALIFLKWLYDGADMYLTRKYNRYIEYYNISETNIA